MSSKTNNQKATQKTAAEKPEAKAGDEAPAVKTELVDQEAGDGQQDSDQAAEKTDPAAGDPASDPAAPQDEQVSEPDQKVLSTMTVQLKVEFSGDLASRLTKAVNGILTSGKPDSVHALHKIEMLVGGLKTSLPAAIEASEGLADDGLKTDLLALLANL